MIYLLSPGGLPHSRRASNVLYVYKYLLSKIQDNVKIIQRYIWIMVQIILTNNQYEWYYIMIYVYVRIHARFLAPGWGWMTPQVVGITTTTNNNININNNNNNNNNNNL
jgi:hypothetical protein